MKAIPIVAIIPARGGSKGIKKKNLIDLNSIPLLVYTVTASLSSRIDQTWVSTDSPDIMRVAGLYGAKVIVRPDEISKDESSTEEAIYHFLMKINCEIVVMIQATSPMLTAEDINNGLDLYDSGKYDTIFSAVRTDDMLVWKPTKKGTIKPINYNYRKRGFRQTRNTFLLIESGGFYIFSRRWFLENRCRLGGRIGWSEVPFWRYPQVDNKTDVKNIRKLMGK